MRRPTEYACMSNARQLATAVADSSSLDQLEYAAMSDTTLRKLDVDCNGLGPGAELRRRAIAANLRRNPAQLLAQLERAKQEWQH
ncbi:MAG: hypothetical protein ACLP4W_08760 [Mycobacterium sp.]|uniref:hypothetical protein n=1 Tax=Mycobacterium sp. TaxID=1785 RepID=UPI003F9B0671